MKRECSSFKGALILQPLEKYNTYCPLSFSHLLRLCDRQIGKPAQISQDTSGVSKPYYIALKKKNLLEMTEWLINRDQFEVCCRNWPWYRVSLKGYFSFSFLLLKWRRLCNFPITTDFSSVMEMEFPKMRATLL